MFRFVVKLYDQVLITNTVQRWDAIVLCFNV